MRESRTNRVNALCKSMEAVLPIACDSRQDLSRAQILFDTFDFHQAQKAIDVIYVVHRPGEGSLCRELHCDIPIIFQDEREWIGRLNVTAVNKRPGWFVQQIIKLAAANFIHKPYLVLDADCFLMRKVEREELEVGGKAAASFITKIFRHEWWRNSSRTLQIPMNWKTPGIDVTPQVLHPEICKRLMTHLEMVHGQPWKKTLSGTCHWTEFTAYQLVAEHYGMMDLLESVPLTAWTIHLESRFDAWNPADSADITPFGLCHSYIEIDPERVRRKLYEAGILQKKTYL